jgi:metal-responsive CopG/Arc/MetJ family transcriptional regulator
MSTTRVAVSLRTSTLRQLDRLVKSHKYPNRSDAIEEALREKVFKTNSLERECAKLNRKAEQALAEEGMESELDEWPEY